METKYKNIRFCHPSSNEECKRLLFQHISNGKKNRPLGYIPNAISDIQRVSKSVENTVRQLLGSERNRFLMYDVIYEGKYHTRMREVDLVNIKSPDTIQIGEVKITSNRTHAIQCGSQQLQITKEILKERFKNVKCVLIIINLIDDSNDDETRDSLFSNSKTIKKESCFEYELIEISANSLLNYIQRENISSINDEELQASIEEAMRNYEKREQSKIDKISERIEKMIYEIKQRKNHI